MKNYKNYIIAVGILILGIVIGNITTRDDKEATHSKDEHNFVQDPVTKLWTCSMHPQIKLEKPGSCPICGMDLIPLDGGENSKESIAGDEIVMSENAVQLANIQTSKVIRSNTKKEIRLLGVIKPDERRLYAQVSHIPGRIEKLYVNFTGEKVRKGQRIVRLYSPELISAQKELFEAMKSKDIYPQLFKASKSKLKLWKLTDNQIDAIINSGKVQEQIDILSDYSGYIMQRNIALGEYVKAGSKLFGVANLDKVWVMFDAYESDISWIHNGDKVSFTVQAIPGKEFKGKVTYMDPFITQKTRVAKVRVEVNNQKHGLLPEMFVNGIIQAGLTDGNNALVVPKSAVLWTGKRAVVYVKIPHEKTISFVYREVILGSDLGDFYIIENGLEEGEVVATNGVFRIDASAQLLGKKSMMNQNNDFKNKDSKSNSSVDNFDVSKKFQNQLGVVVDVYILLKDAFVLSNSDKAHSTSIDMKKALDEVDMKLLKGDAQHIWTNFLSLINNSLVQIHNSKNIEEQRKAFGSLSQEMYDMLHLFGFVTKNKRSLFFEFCPMADHNKGAYWLSYDKEIRNPFFGDSMLECGEVKKELKSL